MKRDGFRFAAKKPVQCLFLLALTAFLAAGPAAASARASSAKTESFGQTKAGTPVHIYTLTNNNGLVLKLTDYGARAVALDVPDAQGHMQDVILGFDNIQGYESTADQYFGATIGRVANRIADAKFTLNGHTYHLVPNDNGNALHGGGKGSFDQLVWHGNARNSKWGPSVEFSTLAKDGQGGFPGNLKVHVTYTLTNSNSMVIHYTATTDAPTPINLTNHTYFNLSGAGNGTILHDIVTINASKYTPVNKEFIPTGAIDSVKGTPYDFREPTPVGARIQKAIQAPTNGYDDNMILIKPTGSGTLTFAARVYDPQSGRVLDMYTTEPAIQFYSGNFLRGDKGRDGKSYDLRGALTLEAQQYIGAVNHPNFPSITLNPGETYRQTTIYHFSAVPAKGK